MFQRPLRVRFGEFEIDEHAGELRKQGIKVRLQEQPLQILQILLEHPGEVVTREELRKRVWPSDTFVDFDHGINNAIKRLREALGDTAETPRFVETLPRRGYRFVANLDVRGKAEIHALIDQLARLKDSSGVDLVAIDSLSNFLPGGTENLAPVVLEMLAPLRRLTERRMAVLLLHHPKKGAMAEGQEVTFKQALAMPTRAEAIGRVLSLALSPAQRVASQIVGPAGRVAAQIKTLSEKTEAAEPAPEAAPT